MLILVKNLDGKTVSVRVESSSDTVASVKAKLEELEGIPPQRHNLLGSVWSVGWEWDGSGMILL